MSWFNIFSLNRILSFSYLWKYLPGRKWSSLSEQLLSNSLHLQGIALVWNYFYVQPYIPKTINELKNTHDTNMWRGVSDCSSYLGSWLRLFTIAISHFGVNYLSFVLLYWVWSTSRVCVCVCVCYDFTTNYSSEPKIEYKCKWVL